MARSNVQHRKHKNTGILFELLVRQVTVDTFTGEDDSPALRLVREYFKQSTELGKELMLYRTLLECTNLSETRADRAIELVIKQRKKLNNHRLNEMKYHLVREIKELYPLKDFLSAKIPNYKVYASIYKLFMSETSPQKIEIRDVGDLAKSRFTLMEHMTASPKEQKRETALEELFRSQTEDLRLLTYKILVDKFNEKYGEGLNENQKELIRKYINNVSNTNSLREHINDEVPKVKDALESRIHRVDDKVTKIKLKEVVAQLDGITSGRVVKDSQVTALMIAYQMIREIDNLTEDK